MKVFLCLWNAEIFLSRMKTFFKKWLRGVKRFDLIAPVVQMILFHFVL